MKLIIRTKHSIIEIPIRSYREAMVILNSFIKMFASKSLSTEFTKRCEGTKAIQISVD